MPSLRLASCQPGLNSKTTVNHGWLNPNIYPEGREVTHPPVCLLVPPPPNMGNEFNSDFLGYCVTKLQYLTATVHRVM